MIQAPLPPTTFEERLRFEGRLRYHDSHPFNERMHAGQLTPAELRVWVENRYYYQSRLPIKDALILAKSEDPAFRREWARRIREQDGSSEFEPDGRPASRGGLDLWLDLAEGTGLGRARVASCSGVLRDVRVACDRYVALVQQASLVEAVASSLTECFAPELMERRILAWEKHYAWVPRRARTYFEQRVGRARRDSEQGLAFVLEHATTRHAQERCIAALITKCGVLWTMLDAIEEACLEGRRMERTA
ncbi:MAG TPA: pyrroloquinoline-quinone synthase PqqC [Polyangiaceae bacterium]